MIKPLHVLVALAAASAVAFVIAADGSDREPYLPVQGAYFPATRIISFEDTVGRLDTRTGAVYRVFGNFSNPSTQMTWRLRVPPVREANSGLLEIQRATFNRPEAIFLVDIVRGTTWILRRRGPERATWDLVSG